MIQRPLFRRVAPLAVAAALAAAVPLAAMAAEHQDQSDAAVMNAAKVSLAQAIATAEQQTGGKAFDAVDNENGTARISVRSPAPGRAHGADRPGQRRRHRHARGRRRRRPGRARGLTGASAGAAPAAPAGWRCVEKPCAFW